MKELLWKSYLLAEIAREEVRMAMNGDGTYSSYLITSVFVFILCEV